MPSYFHFRDGKSEAQSSKGFSWGDIKSHWKSWHLSPDSWTPSTFYHHRTKYLRQKDQLCQFSWIETRGSPSCIRVYCLLKKESACRQGPPDKTKCKSGVEDIQVLWPSHSSLQSLSGPSQPVPQMSHLHQQPFLFLSHCFSFLLGMEFH